MIRVVIADDHLIVREGLRLILETDPEIELVGDAHGKKGDRETKQAIFRLVRDLELEGITTHHSYLQFSELIQLSLESHLFVAPSVTALSGDREGTPFVVQQMMATGMPVRAAGSSDSIGNATLRGQRRSRRGALCALLMLSLIRPYLCY